MKKHYRVENDCLNCGTLLEGKYCHNCGQENLQIKESFGHMMNHAISDYFHFDHQFFHTLRPLFLKPGKLTNEYMAGRRVQYLHPVKMYIFISIVYFLLLFQSGFDPISTTHTSSKAETKKTLDTVNKALDKVAKNPFIPVAAKKAILDQKKAVDADIRKDSADDDDDDTTAKKITSNDVILQATTNDTTYTQYLASQKKLAPDEQDGFFKRLYNKRAFTYKEKYGPRAKQEFVEEFKHNIPKMMFLMLPLCALILRITFWRNKKYYVEHLIYTFHLHCFLFLFLAVIMILQMVQPAPASWHVNGWLDFIATIGTIWYIYKSLRVVYHRGRGRTISKMIGMTLSYFFVFTFCMVLVLLITAITIPA